MFGCLLIFRNGYSQICLHIDEGPKRVVVNTDHVIKVKVLNVPTGASVKLWANKQRVYIVNGEAELKFTDSIISFHEVEIDVRVEVDKKIVFSEKRVLEFTFFKPDIALQIKGSDYFYRGLNTDFKLTVSGFPNFDLILTSFAFSIRKFENSDYRASVNNKLEELKLGVSLKYFEDSFLNLEKKIIKVYDLPRPNFNLSCSIDSILSSDTILNLHTIVPPDLMGRVQPQIENLTVQIWSATGVQNFIANGSEIKGELLEIIKKMKSGDLLYFKNIQFKWHEKQTEPMLINTVAFSRS